MKSIPLSVPMGGDSASCIHDDECREIVSTINSHIRFRCPLMVEVEDDVEFPEWHESCFDGAV